MDTDDDADGTGERWDTRPKSRRSDDDDDNDNDDYELDTGPRRRPENDFNPASVVAPIDVDPFSVIAFFTGIIGTCIPGFGVVALTCGIVALRRRRKRVKSTSYGAVTGDVRAWIGIACGVWGTVLTLAVAVALIAAALGK